MVSRLIRALAPETSRISRDGTPAEWANKAISASFASPSIAAARTRALSTHCPSARCSMPSMASRRRAASAAPRPKARRLRRSTAAAVAWRLNDSWVDVADDHILDQDDDQDHDHRRDIDAAEAGHHVADRAQHRLRDPEQEIADHRDELVARVDDIERHQPRQHRRRDQQPDIQIKNEKDD